MGLQLQHPEFMIGFLAVPFIGLLFWYMIKWKENVTAKIGDQRLVRDLIIGYSPFRFILKFALGLLALTTVIMSMVNPVKPGAMEKVERKGVDVMIALDVSNSMLAQDIKPNRLEKAKQIVNRLIYQLADDRIGLVLFAGRAYMQMPLTSDHGAAGMYVQNAAPDVVPAQGTMISDALRLCTSAFNPKERKYKSIILITDGEDHDPESLEVANQLSSNGVVINTIGIGSTLGTPIPDPATGQFKKDGEGNTVLSKLNEQQLKQLAAATNGIFISPQNLDDAAAVISKQLSAIEDKAIEDSAFKDLIHYFYWFAGAALLLLVVEFFIPERKVRSVA
jgi:Ca-activated chloride channel homolog